MPTAMTNPYAELHSIAFIGNYLPRQCGIATFTTDLVQAVSRETSEQICWSIAMNDTPEGYDYPSQVRFEINQKQPGDYRLAAEFLNINQADVLCVQHEFGIYGGPAGTYLLNLLADVRMPVVTTLHTVLLEPDPEVRKVMLRLAELSERLVVMSRRAADILESVYAIDRSKIVFIPHGIPDMPFVDSNYYKDRFGLLGKKVLLTFGLISRNKGIEYVLKALPKVVERFPDIVYIVLGATHPNILAADGENYRLHLQQLVRELNLERQVIFRNRFVPIEELCDYLAAADIYLTPYIQDAQVTSGTLAYAMGTGKAVVSTPYWHAEELLADGRGCLVPFKNPEAIGEVLIRLLDDDTERHTIRKRAYDFSRAAVWKEVARSYLRVFCEAKANRSVKPRLYRVARQLKSKTDFSQDLPEMKLDHLFAMTDDTGLLQHARYTIPERLHGYCTDDNARALIVASEAHRLLADHPPQHERLCDRYLSFLLHAFDAKTGRFRNFMSYDRCWLEEIGSEDSHGRALWALGIAVNSLNGRRQLPVASNLFKQALPAAETFFALRPISFTLIGLHEYLGVFSGDSEARRLRAVLADRLYQPIRDHAREDWPWFEDTLTYANAKLPQALLVSGQGMKRGDLIEMGLKSLEWLFQIQCLNGVFVPVGNRGWYPRGQNKARFDQQPIEAHAMVDACVAAYRIEQEQKWLRRAKIAFNWFLGQNDLSLPLYDAKTGGCCDGLQSDGVNQNQGAESTLAWLHSLASLLHLSADAVVLTASRPVSRTLSKET